MELKAWAVTGKRKSFWRSKRLEWTVGVVDTASAACQKVNMLNKWSADQVKRTKKCYAPASGDGNPPLLMCPWDVKWTLSDAKNIEYTFGPLFVFPNYVKEL